MSSIRLDLVFHLSLHLSLHGLAPILANVNLATDECEQIGTMRHGSEARDVHVDHLLRDDARLHRHLTGPTEHHSGH